MNRYAGPIADLIERPEILRLHRREAHHFLQSRYEHSLATARLSYYASRILRADVRVTTRAAFLHDWYFEARDDHANRVGANVHHYRISAANARGIGEATPVIEAIESHMWPWGNRPRTREAWIVWMADNITWLTDYLVSAGKYLRFKARAFLYGPQSGAYAA